MKNLANKGGKSDPRELTAAPLPLDELTHKERSNSPVVCSDDDMDTWLVEDPFPSKVVSQVLDNGTGTEESSPGENNLPVTRQEFEWDRPNCGIDTVVADSSHSGANDLTENLGLKVQESVHNNFELRMQTQLRSSELEIQNLSNKLLQVQQKLALVEVGAADMRVTTGNPERESSHSADSGDLSGNNNENPQTHSFAHIDGKSPLSENIDNAQIDSCVHVDPVSPEEQSEDTTATGGQLAVGDFENVPEGTSAGTVAYCKTEQNSSTESPKETPLQATDQTPLRKREAPLDLIPNGQEERKKATRLLGSNSMDDGGVLTPVGVVLSQTELMDLNRTIPRNESLQTAPPLPDEAIELTPAADTLAIGTPTPVHDTNNPAHDILGINKSISALSAEEKKPSILRSSMLINRSLSYEELNLLGNHRIHEIVEEELRSITDCVKFLHTPERYVKWCQQFRSYMRSTQLRYHHFLYWLAMQKTMSATMWRNTFRLCSQYGYTDCREFWRRHPKVLGVTDAMILAAFRLPKQEGRSVWEFCSDEADKYKEVSDCVQLKLTEHQHMNAVLNTLQKQVRNLIHVETQATDSNESWPRFLMAIGAPRLKAKITSCLELLEKERKKVLAQRSQLYRRDIRGLPQKQPQHCRPFGGHTFVNSGKRKVTEPSPPPYYHARQPLPGGVFVGTPQRPSTPQTHERKNSRNTPVASQARPSNSLYNNCDVGQCAREYPSMYRTTGPRYDAAIQHKRYTGPANRSSVDLGEAWYVGNGAVQRNKTTPVRSREHAVLRAHGRL